MQLHQLKYFVSVVNTGSITQAAKQCFISQPSISQQITKLETTLGKKLFAKVDGKLQLTEPGQILYDQASKILQSVEDTKRQVDDCDSTSGGTVNIGILPTLASYMLPSILATLSQKFPNAVVTIREEISESLTTAVKLGELDILIEALPFDETNLQVDHLFIDPFYLAVHREHPLATKEAIHVNDIDDSLSFILLEDVHCLTQQIEKLCFNEHFLPKASFQASHINTIKTLIEAKYGVSILPSISINQHADSQIQYIKLISDDHSPFRKVVLATARDRYLSPAAKYLIDTVKQQYQDSVTHHPK